MKCFRVSFHNLTMRWTHVPMTILRDTGVKHYVELHDVVLFFLASHAVAHI